MHNGCVASNWQRTLPLAGKQLACLGVGMLGDRPAGSAKGRLTAPPGLPKGPLPLLLGPKGLTGVLSAGETASLQPQ